MHLPEDGHMSGRNMQVVYYVYSVLSYTYMPLLVLISCTSNVYVRHLIIHNLLLFKDGGQCLDILLTVLRRKSVVDSEELVHSVLSTLNNLSYYPTSNDGAFGERQLEIAQGTMYFIL
jgi:hypothetical protein